MIKRILVFGAGVFGLAGLWAERPNVLFIAIDDLNPSIGIYGAMEVATPHMDRLGASGTTFLNAACQFPVCGPSRASLLTGLRPEATGVLDLKTKMRDVHPDILTLPQYFKQSGYTTAAVGKIFDARCVDSRRQGDAISWTIPYNENPNPFGVTAISEGKRVTQSIDAPDEAFIDGRIGRRGVELLGELSAGDSPFFLAVGFKKPHLPFVAPKRFWDQYDPAKILLATFQAETAGNSGFGYWNSNEIRTYEGVPKEGPLDPDFQRHLIHGYYACTSWVDEWVGRLTDELAKQGLAENTIVVLWGDHGWHLGDHGLWGKHTVFESAIRAPLIIVDPRLKSGGATAAPVEFTDVFPTLCELAGLPRPSPLQGVSLRAALTSPEARPRAASIAYRKSKGAAGYSVRTERYRYIEWIDLKTAELVGQDLFDFELDPEGKRNWVDDPGHFDAVAMMQGHLHADTAGWHLLQRHLARD
jgi:arylsulfatase A-like enzyme